MLLLLLLLLQVFAGNINTYIAELREINPPIIARRIRLIPHSNHPRTICLRLELYGCLWRGRCLLQRCCQLRDFLAQLG